LESDRANSDLPQPAKFLSSFGTNVKSTLPQNHNQQTTEPSWRSMIWSTNANWASSCQKKSCHEPFTVNNDNNHHLASFQNLQQ
jgi:hypothetical protein